MSIQHVIHYCWFGGSELTEEVLFCIESWKKHCPDYKIVRWDESNYDVNKNDFLRQAYAAGKWAFVSDYARLDIVYNNGGIYLDTDVEVIKPLDDMIAQGLGFFGFEYSGQIASGLGFAAKQYDPILKQMLDYYHDLTFDLQHLDKVLCPKINSLIFEKNGAILNNKKQKVGDFILYPSEYFCPINNSTARKEITANTVTIHHYSGSWMLKKNKTKRAIVIGIKKILPLYVVNKIREIVRKARKA